MKYLVRRTLIRMISQAKNGKYTIRPLDRVKARGKTEAVMIYAVSEGDDSTER